MIARQNIKRFLVNNRAALLVPLGFVLLSVILLIINGSFIFEYSFLDKYGDQHLYHRLSQNLIHADFAKSPYTLGYPIFMLPFELMTGVPAVWTSIMGPLIFVQAFLLMPLNAFLLVVHKTKRHIAWIAGLLVVYFLSLLRSGDILINYNFLGLMPLSEPLAVTLLLSVYYVYLRYVRGSRNPRNRYLLALGALTAVALMTRNTLAILLAPIFVDMLRSKDLKKLFTAGALAGLFYMPQLAYNYLSSGDLFFNGYVWWANGRVEKNMRNIESLYGLKTSAMFSVHYFSQNVIDLLPQYLVVVIMAAMNAVKRNRFTLLVLGFTALNLIFHLAYWWSKAGGLMDRFLLPNVFLLLFMFGNTYLERTRHERN